VQRLVRELNQLYRSQSALYQQDFVPDGFDWIDHSDHAHSVLSFVRWSAHRASFVVVVCNFTPQVRSDYRIGVPRAGHYAPLLNTDATRFGGSGVCCLRGHGGDSEPVPWQGQPHSLRLTLPPLSTVFLQCTV